MCIRDRDKSLADSKALLPVLIDFFQKHPLINSKTFLGDAAVSYTHLTMLLPFGLLLDLWECHKQFLGLAKPKRELTIDDVIPYGI